MSGRKRRFPDFKKQNKWGKARCYRQAFNYLIQSAGADMTKIAAGKCVKDKNLKLVNLVHDELCFECPKDYVSIAIPFITECMCSAMKMSIPLEVDIHVGERYGDCK